MGQKGNRAQRRHDDQRVRDKRSKISWAKNGSDKLLGKLLHTAALCTCWMCGNPRKYFKEKTLQEKSFDEVAKRFER